ncbi:hypothetical protein [Brenneria sp. L4-2C]|uniref:hypothetical protein n=1 Tax=Brenneria sp. L4-2C TaxID=3094863 RepID=UPI0029C4E571|nr:hypothetical protein [Brenneria sp. L4-2C]MDX5630819.1 hypothetical protein [Brenneria sp. L3-3Z]
MSKCKIVKAKSRRDAIKKAQQHSQVPRPSRGGRNIHINKLNPGCRGKNWSEMKSQGGTKLGRENQYGKNKWFEHPDAGLPNVPKHHDSGHIHSTNPKG